MLLETLPFDRASLHEAYEAGLDPKAVLDEFLRRLAAAQDPGIFIHLASVEELAAAADALGDFDPQTKALWGLPCAVKDNIDVAGMPTTAGAPAFAFTAEADATAVARLKAAGAIIVGKSNLDQFATGLVGVRTPYPVPRNAIDPEIVPGGSSSGSAVAVAGGLVTFALGTDTAGSGRVPAALNNIVGLKPSLGVLSSNGMLPACRTLDTISVFALTVDDAYAAFRAMAAHDPEDAYSRPTPNLQPTPKPSRFKVGAPDDASRIFFGDDAQRQSFEDALSRLEALGGEITPIDFAPFYEVAKLLYEGPWVAERYAALREVIETRPEILHPTTRAIVEGAGEFSAADAFDGVYRLAELRRAAAPALASVDFLCAPSIPTFYSVDDLDADPFGPNARLGTYTNFVNLLDLAGLAVPTGPRIDGRPGGVTLLAPWGDDALLASIGSALHQAAAPTMGATGCPLPQPAPEIAPEVDGNEIAVALVGAHMQGLPLNHEVAGRGGRFLRSAYTSDEYRLYSLAGGPPKRPGMLRAEDGAQIALEVWAMPRAAFGDFMAGIPQPLGIGTVNLADGGQVKGFLCEPAGLAGAEDITEFGGWRAYLESLTVAATA